MTRGTFVLFAPENVFESVEFNGDMYFSGHGEEAAKEIAKVDSFLSFVECIKEFNEKHFGYPEEEVKAYSEVPRFAYDDMLDMSAQYFEKYFSDYIFIKNISGEDLTFTLASKLGNEHPSYILPDGKSGVLYFGEEATDFPKEINAFLPEGFHEKRAVYEKKFGLEPEDILWFCHNHEGKEITEIFDDIGDIAEKDAIDTGILTEKNRKYFNFYEYVQDFRETVLANSDNLVVMPSEKIAVIE